MQPLTFEKVFLKNGFWHRRQEINRTVTIPVEYEQSKKTGRIDAFALQWKEGSDLPKPHIFWDSDVAKWVEAASYSLTTHYDETLDKLLDEVTALIVSSQQPDGYINSYFTAVAPHKRFSFLQDDHELYCAGHLMEAAVAHFKATGKRHFLEAMCRYADLLTKVFGTGEGQIPGYGGHEEIELALFKLYEATGEKRYLDLAEYFIEQRGQEPLYYEIEAKRENRPYHPPYYYQAHKPVREQEPVGHAVRALYLYAGMADLARYTQDPTLIDACKRIWNEVTLKHMYITGGIGASATNEGFQQPYDLPNDLAYCETCASAALVFFASRMLALTGERKYADVMEKTLYNGLLAGISADGKRFFYDNPLEVRAFRSPRGIHRTKWYRRSEWFGCACCPSNLSRLLASLSGYFITYDKESVALHLFDHLETAVPFAEGEVPLLVETDYPKTGRIKITVGKNRPLPAFKLRVRVPGWCKEYSLSGVECAVSEENGYLVLEREWQPSDCIVLDFPMQIKRIYAHAKIHYNLGRVALSRGPVVYCIEDVDFGVPVQTIALPLSAELSEKAGDELPVITGSAYAAVSNSKDEAGLYGETPPRLEPIPFQAVPYFSWGNRDEGGMLVYIREVR